MFDGGTFSGDYTLRWNGKTVSKEMLKKARVYDMSNIVFKPDDMRDENLLEVVFEQAGEFDGVNSEMYIMQEEISNDANG